jgi:hypothetical protein
MDSGVSHGNMHQARRGTDLFGSTRLRSNTKKSGSARRGTLLADRLRTLWGISAVTCSIAPVDTSFVRQIGLPRVNACNV